MYLTGFADEAADGIAGQIEATLALGWNCIKSGRRLENIIASIGQTP